MWLKRTFTFVLPGERLPYHYTTEEKGHGPAPLLDQRLSELRH